MALGQTKTKKSAAKPKKHRRSAKKQPSVAVSVIARLALASAAAVCAAAVCISLLLLFHRSDFLPGAVRVTVELLCIAAAAASALLLKTYFCAVLDKDDETNSQSEQPTETPTTETDLNV